MKVTVLTFLIAIIATSVQAQSVPAYLADEADTAIRVEIIIHETAPKSLLSKIQSLLGVRRPEQARPAVGTTFVVNSSAYAPSPYQTDSTPCVTASGTKVRPGVVASNFLPLGTLLNINGQEFIVEDRMNPRFQGYFVDVWFGSTSEAIEFGRRELTITVTGYVEPGHSIRESKKTEKPEEQTVIGKVIDVLSHIGSFLGARSPEELNRFDADCFEEESE